MDVPAGHVAAVPEYLEEARSLSRRGRYSDAIALLKKACDHQNNDLRLLFDLAETHTTQGYINRAHSLLTKHDSGNGLAVDLLRMLRCFLEPIICGQFSANVAEAEKINSKYHFEACADTDWLSIVRRPWLGLSCQC